MVQSMKGNGLRTSRTDMALKRGRTVQSILETTRKAASTVTEIFIGPMVQSMMEHSLRTIFMVMVITLGAINGNTMVSGAEIRCMELVFSLGVMAELMKEHTIMTKSMVEVSSSGLMGVYMMGNGSQGSNMGLEHTFLLRLVRNVLVNGKMGRDYAGHRRFC